MRTWNFELIKNVIEPITECVMQNNFSSAGWLFADNHEFWIPEVDGEGSAAPVQFMDLQEMATFWDLIFPQKQIFLTSVEYFEVAMPYKKCSAHYFLTSKILSEKEQVKFDGVTFEATFTDEIELDESGKIFRVNRSVLPGKVRIGNPDVLWNGWWA